MGCVSYVTPIYKGSYIWGGELGNRNLVRVYVTREGYEILTLIEGKILESWSFRVPKSKIIERALKEYLNPSSWASKPAKTDFIVRTLRGVSSNTSIYKEITENCL